MEDPPTILTKYKTPIVGILLVTIIIGLAILLSQFNILSPYKVEIIEVTSTPAPSAPKLINVDISGAVVAPKVYEIQSGSRIGEVIEVAGGLRSDADVDWVDKNINRAALAVDGQKVYIPTISDLKTTVLSEKTSSDVQVSTTVNINTAGQKELEDLWGIGPATAKKLIDNRPYQSVEELLSKKILKLNVYEKIKNQLSI